MRIECECGNINIFRKDKNIRKFESLGSGSFYIRLNNKDYICEKCGVDLEF